MTQPRVADSRRPRPQVDTASLSRLQNEVLLSLYQHRLLSVQHIHALHTPESSLQWTRKVIDGLRQLGHVQRVFGPAARYRARPGLWFLTTQGYGVVAPNGATTVGGGEVSRRSYRMTPDRASGPLQAHLLEVNAVGTAFVQWARHLGHLCSWADWDNEVALRIADKPTDGPYTDLLTADAVLRMTLIGADDSTGGLTRFVELDRGTKNVARVHEQLRRYAQLYAYAPGGAREHLRYSSTGRQYGWERLFPERFPPVLVIFTGLADRHLHTRIATLTSLCTSDPFLSRFADPMGLSFTTLDRVTESGPFAGIWTRPFGGHSGLVDIFGQPAVTGALGVA